LNGEKRKQEKIINIKKYTFVRKYEQKNIYKKIFSKKFFYKYLSKMYNYKF